MALKPSTPEPVVHSGAAALAALPNLGPRSAQILCQAGISSVEQLQQLGPLDSYRQVVASGARPSLNLLWAIAGALHNCHWTRLPDGLRSALLLALDATDDTID